MSMTTWKSRILKFFVTVFALSMAMGYAGITPVQAASKASYTIQKNEKKKTYKNSSASYLYELPVLKGKSSAVKKINKSLKASYTKSLKDQKNLFKVFQNLKKDGTLKTKNLQLLATTRCKEAYNKDGYVKFAFTTTWYDGSKRTTSRKNVIYRLKDGKTVKSIPKKKSTTEKGLDLIQGTWYSMGGVPYHYKDVISGNTIKSYRPGSSVCVSEYKIDKVYKTSYGYYYRIPLGRGYYSGYRLEMKNKKTLICMGNGSPDSTSGYSGTGSRVRNK